MTIVLSLITIAIWATSLTLLAQQPPRYRY